MTDETIYARRHEGKRNVFDDFTPVRIPVSKKKRFEIFERDEFRCTYCGAGAKTTWLEIDHIIPVSLGGSNNDSNLTTACGDCNAGKSDSLLYPHTQVEHLTNRLALLFDRFPVEREIKRILKIAKWNGAPTVEKSIDFLLDVRLKKKGRWPNPAELIEHVDGISAIINDFMNDKTVKEILAYAMGKKKEEDKNIGMETH